MKDPNLFEDKEIAKQWISSIEITNGRNKSREQEIYPLLNLWSKQLNNSTIVEIGSGQGICSSKLDLSSNTYIGIEPSQFLIDRANKLYKSDKITFIKGDSYSTTLPSMTADAVFSVGVWFHVENLDKAHEEINRIMKSGGRLLIVTANPNAQKMWESFFENPKVDGKRIEGKISVPNGYMNNNILYLHSKEEITDSLKKNGFSQISIKDTWLKKDWNAGMLTIIEAIKN